MLRALTLLVLSAQSLPADPHLAAVRKALDLTASKTYAFQVKGRFERAGEWLPEGVLSSRMKQYQSARHGERILVKGPEGLWKTPEERLGEKVERPDPDAADIVRTLEGAEAPHRIVARLLEDVDKGRPSEDREIDGVVCSRYQLYYRTEAMKEAISKQLEKAIQSGGLSRPDEIRWSSSLKGTLRLYVHRKEGRLLKAIDEKSVKLAYKVPDQQPDVKSYRLEMEIDLSDWGKTELRLPPEVREKLGLREP